MKITVIATGFQGQKSRRFPKIATSNLAGDDYHPLKDVKPVENTREEVVVPQEETQSWDSNRTRADLPSFLKNRK